MKRLNLSSTVHVETLWRLVSFLVLAVFLGVAWSRSLDLATAARLPKNPGLVNAQQSSAPAAAGNLYLPLVLTTAPPQALLGVYTPGVFFNTQQLVNSYMLSLDSWAGLSRSAGKGHSLAGTFIDIEDGAAWYDVPVPADLLWNNGYMEFINLGSTHTSAAIASGAVDAQIHTWAKAYHDWVIKGGNRRAFIAPLQEMNGNWTVYGYDPVNFKAAYQRIQSIFALEGVSRSQVWWTFAPNGWSTPGYSIKDYYPGDSIVDVVGFSSYNYGSCKGVAWQTPEQTFGPYIREIRQQVTSSKPLFIAQTATSSAGGDKDQWLRDTYAYAIQNNIRAILYFNADKECDWAVYQPGGRQVQGYRDGVNTAGFLYMDPVGLSLTPLTP